MGWAMDLYMELMDKRCLGIPRGESFKCELRRLVENGMFYDAFTLAAASDRQADWELARDARLRREDRERENWKLVSEDYTRGPGTPDQPSDQQTASPAPRPTETPVPPIPARDWRREE